MSCEDRAAGASPPELPQVELLLEAWTDLTQDRAAGGSPLELPKVELLLDAWSAVVRLGARGLRAASGFEA